MCQVRECDGDKMEDGEYNADRGQKQMLCWIQGSIPRPSVSNISLFQGTYPMKRSCDKMVRLRHGTVREMIFRRVSFYG